MAQDLSFKQSKTGKGDQYRLTPKNKQFKNLTYKKITTMFKNLFTTS